LNVPVFRNTVLQHLPQDVIQRLELTHVKLPVDREIEYPGNEIKSLIFIERGVGSMTTTFTDGSQVEIALAGSESVLGASALLGTHHSLNRVYMQIAGEGYSTRRVIAAEEFQRSGEFHRLVLRYTQAQFIQSAQTAGCNARHSIQQRLARWLLLVADRVEDNEIQLSQDYIAHMLGVQRSSVSIQAAKLQKGGMIHYTRGKIEIVDREKLERKACECYGVVRDHLSNYADTDIGLGR
jgi:CRP-like cAMP-binding protein